MYCDKTNVNVLSALLAASGVGEMVVCPGSRNGVLVHNFHLMAQRLDDFHVHQATDERSAAFMALGLTLARRRPAAVCVTSGSALLATIPAVAEAYYRDAPLLVISADRPPQMIGQLDGQTIVQQGALRPYTETFQLDETTDNADTTWLRQTVSRALAVLTSSGGRPVHINVPISEPLFSFSTPHLPALQPIRLHQPKTTRPLPEELIKAIKTARLPMLVVGHLDDGDRVVEWVRKIDLNRSLLVVPDIVASVPFSKRMAALERFPALADRLLPDLVVHVGGALTGKALKQKLRANRDLRVWRIDHKGEMPDTFGALCDVVECAPIEALKQLAEEVTQNNETVCRMAEEMDRLSEDYRPQTPAEMLMAQIATCVEQFASSPVTLHLANSTTVRAMAPFIDGGRRRILCNRGVNGIEGSVSVAAGHSLAAEGLSLLVTGDLSFFYDQNALWTEELDGRLRIVVMNDGHGGIFDHLPGLSASPATPRLIAGSHHATAEGTAETFGLTYKLTNSHSTALANNLAWLLTVESIRPVVLEVKMT
ncbi:MAG: 2-succinyl-5-enolpyruvyl-6-hydroxy-3-cyclohexene-1-carboxylic-acid synthase [Alloprevotella sp.]